MGLIAIRFGFSQKNKNRSKKRLGRVVIIQIKGQIDHLSKETQQSIGIR